MATIKTNKELYNEYKKNKSTESSNSSGARLSNRDLYLRYKFPSVAEDVQSRLKTWIDQSEDLISGYNKRYSDQSGAYRADSSQWLSDVSEKKKYFDSEAQEITSVLENYQKFFDPDAYKNITSAMDEYKKVQSDIYNNSLKDNQYWSQWETEEDYNQYLASVEDYNKKVNLDTARYGYETRTKKAALESINDIKDKMKDIEYRLEYAYDDPKDVVNALSRNIEYQDLKDQLGKYGEINIDDLAAEIAEREKYLSDAKKIQSRNELESVKNYSDFEEYSQIGLNVKNPSASEAESFSEIFGKKIGGADIKNEATYARDNAEDLEIARAEQRNTAGNYLYSLMTDEEVAIYSYFIGKNDTKKAQEYLEAITDDLKYRDITNTFERVYKDRPFLEVSEMGGAGLVQFGEGLKNLFSSDQQNYFSPSETQLLSEMIRDDLYNAGPVFGADKNGEGGTSLGQVFGDFAQSSGNMIPSIMASSIIGSINPAAGVVVGNALMGASASGNAYAEAVNLGYNKEQAKAYAALTGASEAGLQYLLGGIGKLGGKISGSALSKLASNLDNAYARLAIDFGGKLISEGSEEYLQEILTPMFKNIAFNEENEIELYTPEALYSGILGALTAGVFEGSGIIINKANALNVGSTFVNNKKSEDLIQTVLDNADPNSDVYKYALEVSPNSKAQVGRLVQIAASDKSLAPLVDGIYSSILNTDTDVESQEDIVNDNISSIQDDSESVINIQTKSGTIKEDVGEIDPEIIPAVFDSVKDFSENGARGYLTLARTIKQEELSNFDVAFRDGYTIGLTGMKYDDPRISKVLDMANSEEDRRIVLRAVEAGNLDRIAAENRDLSNNILQKGKGAVTVEKGAKIDKSNLDVLNLVSDKIGVDVVVSKTIDNGIANGKYENGKIYIAENSNNPIMTVLKHELTHHLQTVAPKGYYKYRDFLTSELKARDSEKFNAILNKIKSGYISVQKTIDMNTIYDEIAADASELFFTDAESIKKFVKQNRSLGEKIRDFLKDLSKKIKSILTGKSISTVTAEQLNQYSDLVDRAQKLWADALEAGINKTVESTVDLDGVKYSLKKSFSQQIDDVLNNKFDKNNHVYVGMTSKKLVDILGVDKLPMLMTPSHIYSMAVSEGKAKSDGRYNKNINYHDLGADTIKKLPEAIDNPVFIIKSNTNTKDNRFVVITDLFDKSGNRVVVAIKPNGDGRYFNIEIPTNILLSGYGKNNVTNYLNSAQKENRILYAYKNYNQQNKNRPGVQFPNHILSADYSNNLAQFRQIVNNHSMQNEKNNSQNSLRGQNTDLGLSREEFIEKYGSSSRISDRHLLANAFENVAKNEKELSMLRDYQKKAKGMDQQQQRLSEVNAELRRLYFEKGKRDTEKIERLKKTQKELTDSINAGDKILLQLEASKPLKDVLEREKKAAYEKAKKQGKQALDEYKERAKAKQEDIIARYREAREKNVEGRKKTEVRHKIQKIVNNLNHLLLHGTKEKNIKIPLQKTVAEALSSINMSTVDYEKRLANIEAQIKTETNPDKRASLIEKYNRTAAQAQRMDKKLLALQDAYGDIRNSNDPNMAGVYDQAINDKIENLRKEIGDTPLFDMTLEQLEKVYDAYKVVYTTVQNANRLFKSKKNESISQASIRAVTEINRVSQEKERSYEISRYIKQFGIENLKPVYVMETIGSDSLKEQFNNIVTGTYEAATDLAEAKAFFGEQSKEYNYFDWDQKKTYKFTSSNGENIELTLGEIMSLYAYSKRKNADAHLEYGGFVHGKSIKFKSRGRKYTINKKNPATINKKTMENITSVLTTEQKNFVDKMQSYLSNELAEKGNSVSRQLYGIDIFKEKNYFPLKSADQFIYQQNDVVGEAKIKNLGMTKDITPGANNPIVLNNFMDVWINHVNDMALYHGIMLPLEDFNRILNFRDTQYGYHSVKQHIENHYGDITTKYLQKLLIDLNGGIRQDGNIGAIDKLYSRFKKSAVYLSLSVAIQQPAAFARAMAYIPAKYFAKSSLQQLNVLNHKTVWEEVKKYAPVAIIKEMGGFDIGTGRSNKSWIMEREYRGISDRAKGIFTDKNYREGLTGRLPQLADEVTWCHIWNASKKMVEGTTDLKPDTEPYFKKAAEIFSEAIEKTQVYESTVSRSGMMRSKNGLTKMITQFMAEPTVSLNMLYDSMLKAKRGGLIQTAGGVASAKKFAAGAAAAVAVSAILTAIGKSIVTAGRDEDEDKTYTEKYVTALTGELIDNLNPLNLVPYVKDVVSIFAGYDVKRSDVQLFSDLQRAIDSLDSDEKSGYDKVKGMVTSLSAFFGVPLKNLERDARGLYNTINSFVNGQETTKQGIKNAFIEGLTGEAVSNGQQLYDAILSGDKVQIDRVISRFKSEDDAYAALRKALRENDPRIREAAQARIEGSVDEYARIAREIIGEGYFSQDDVVKAISAEVNAINRETEQPEEKKKENKITPIYSSSDIEAAFKRGNTNAAQNAIDELVQYYINRSDEKNEKDKEKEAKGIVRRTVTSYWKPLYQKAYKAKDTEEMKRIRYILSDTGLYGNMSDVVDSCQSWIKELAKK